MGKNQILFCAAASLIIILAAAFFNSGVSAQEADNSTITLPSTGVMPDSPLYGLEIALERVRMALTFNKAEKARLGLAYAEERLAELKLLAETNNLGAAEKAKKEHARLMKEVQSGLEKISDKNATKEAEQKIRIENKIREQETAVNEVENEINKSSLTAEQQILLDSLFASFKNSTSNLKLKIRDEIGKTEVKIREGANESEDRAKEIILKIRNETGAINACEIRNRLLVNELEKRIEAIQERLDAENLSGINTTALQLTLQQLKEIRDRAELIIQEKAQSCDDAEKLAENAKEISDDASELETEGTAKASDAISNVIEKMQEMQSEGVKGINTSNVIAKLTAVRASLIERADMKAQIEKAKEMQSNIDEKINELKAAKRELAINALKKANEITSNVRVKEAENESEKTIQEAVRPTTQMTQETAASQTEAASSNQASD